MAAALAAVASFGSSGCSVFSKDGDGKKSVYEIEPEMCFTAPLEVKAEIASLSYVDCSKAHVMEAYAKIPYTATSPNDDYPGADVLSKFAMGQCAQAFTGYVGISYLDSAYYYTYLLPSARGWSKINEPDARTVLCFVITTGKPLTTSVKGTKT